MKTVDVDIGGTFTDCYLNYDDVVATAKASTTTYDLSVGFMKSLEAAASKIGRTLTDLMAEIDSVRYSTTVAMNTLIQRKGPRLGVITTKGFEDITAIGRGSSWQDGLIGLEKRKLPSMSKPDLLVDRKMIVGVRGRVDCFGKEVTPLDEDGVREQLYYLVNQGVRGFVVCLLWSQLNPSHELRIREIIEEEYPDFYLGGMPVVCSHEVLPRRGEYARFMTAILSAYLQQSMSEELSNIYDRLRDMGYKGAFQLVHNTGGVGDVHSTTAIQTYNGGPVAGVIASSYISKLYGKGNAIVSDVGGTSFDMGLVVEGSTRFYDFEPVIDRYLVGVTMLQTRSVGAGGGSIMWYNEALGKLEVGPQSAGAYPGPACYNQGGEEPTSTDADLLLGYINPDYYHGGTLKLSVDRARKSFRKLAGRLGVDPEEVAAMGRKILDAKMGHEIYKETVLRGYDPKDFILYAFGGGGPTHCADYARFAGCNDVLLFPYSAVFCAFGSSTMDTIRFYEKSQHMTLMEPITRKWALDVGTFNEIVRQLREKAIREFKTEGARAEDIKFELSLEMRFGGQIHHFRAGVPVLFVDTEADMDAVYRDFVKQYAEVFSPIGVSPSSGVDIEGFVLKATVHRPKPQFAKMKFQGEDPSAALVGERKAFWEALGGYQSTPVYRFHLLRVGNQILGPAIIESESTTVVVPPDWALTLDEYSNGRMKRVPA